MKLRKAALPSGCILFLFGVIYAGVPAKYHYMWAIDFGLIPDVRVLIGVISFAFGSFLLWSAREDFSRERNFFDSIVGETDEIKRILAKKKTE